jgi:hypothetical protein
MQTKAMKRQTKARAAKAMPTIAPVLNDLSADGWV